MFSEQLSCSSSHSLIDNCCSSHRTHMQDLKEVTDTIHYESYRRKRLTEEKQSDQVVLTKNVVNMDCQESKI